MNNAAGNNLAISDYLTEVYDDWQNSRSEFRHNVYPPAHWPIPFFGNPATARVATIGVNPSSEEFVPARAWPKATVANRGIWKKRLKAYFNHAMLPYGWFDPWSVGLAMLRVGYKEGTAAHFDISYRPTTAMITNSSTNRAEFRAMVVRDVQWLFRLIPLCPELRLLLTMGPILGENLQPIGLLGFLYESAKPHGFKMVKKDESWELWHEPSKKIVVLHEADTPGEKCVTCRVVKNLHVHHQALLARSGLASD